MAWSRQEFHWLPKTRNYTKLQFGTAQLSRDYEGEMPMLPLAQAKAILR
jgi:hypothetical protein